MCQTGIFLFYTESDVFTAQSHKSVFAAVTPPALRPEMRDPSHAMDAVHVVYVVLFSPWKDTLFKKIPFTSSTSWKLLWCSVPGPLTTCTTKPILASRK